MDDCFFLIDNRIIYGGINGFEVYDIEQKKALHVRDDLIWGGMASDGGEYFAVVLDDALWIYETESLSPVYSYPIPEDRAAGDAMFYDEEGKRFVFSTVPDFMAEATGAEIVVMNLENGEILGIFQVKYSRVEKINVAEDVILAAVNQNVNDASPDGKYDLSIPFKSCIYAINMEDLSLKWIYENEEESCYNIQVNTEDFSRHILASYYSEACILNLDTGAMEHEIAFGAEIVASFCYVNSDMFAVITSDGVYHILNGANGADTILAGYFQCNSDNLQVMDFTV